MKELFYFGDKKMLVKIYFLVCALGLLTAAAFYLTGNLSSMMRIVFGFLTFSVVFMGMLSVLPFWSTHHSLPKH